MSPTHRPINGDCFQQNGAEAAQSTTKKKSWTCSSSSSSKQRSTGTLGLAIHPIGMTILLWKLLGVSGHMTYRIYITPFLPLVPLFGQTGGLLLLVVVMLVTAVKERLTSNKVKDKLGTRKNPHIQIQTNWWSTTEEYRETRAIGGFGNLFMSFSATLLRLPIVSSVFISV